MGVVVHCTYTHVPFLQYLKPPLWMTQGTCHLPQELPSSLQHLPLAGGAQTGTSSPTALLPDLGFSQADNPSTKI